MKRSQIAVIAVLALAIAGTAAWFFSQPNRAASDPAPAAPQGSAPPLAGAPRAAGVTTLAVDASSSQARYRVREQLASVSFPIDAVGTTRDISGVVAFAEDGRVLADRSSITVNVTRLQSDQARRDNFIRTNTLETQRYPEVHFIPTEVRGLPMPLPAEGEVPITIAGELTIKNVTRPVQWTGTATFTPEGMTVSANTVITFEEFQIAKPRVALVLSVADEIRLEVDAHFRKQS
ncbi:MAG: YceI family protein [Clostridia bacterium]|nr:hypothetical protein [Bacillota bacterium]MBO2521967.1 hypothetical protein [Bacillota bacterium]